MALVTNDSKDGVSWTGATSNTITFTLLGGKYLFASEAAGTSVTLNILMPSGNYIAVGTSTTLTTSAATAMVDLPAGSYEVVIVSASGISGFLMKIPYLPSF
jgi:hypothetical protein